MTDLSNKVKDDDMLIICFTGSGITEFPEGWTEIKRPWWRRLWQRITGHYYLTAVRVSQERSDP